MGEAEIFYFLRILQQGSMFELKDQSMVEKTCVFDQIFTRSILYIFLMYISMYISRLQSFFALLLVLGFRDGVFSGGVNNLEHSAALSLV